MNYICFDVSIENDIAHIILNRPNKRNSMIPEFWDELPTIVRDIDQNASARVIVLSSTGPHFTSGLDTSVFGSSIESSESRAAKLLFFRKRFYLLGSKIFFKKNHES